MRDLVRAFAPVLLVLAGAGGLRAQDPGPGPTAEGQAAPAVPPTFAVEVEQVIVDLVVTDKKGNPVPGILRDDLIVTEDGVPQTTESFEAVDVQETPVTEPPPPPRVSRNTDAEPPDGRTFVIVFDDLNMTPARAWDAKAAVARFLDSGAWSGDSVTLIATSGAVWWTTRMPAGRDGFIDSLKRLDGRRIPDSFRERMSDWEAMRIHVFLDAQVMGQVMRRFDEYGVSRLSQLDGQDQRTGTLSDPFVTARASEVYLQSRDRTRRTLEALERTLNGLAGARGRKAVILVSEGFVQDSSIAEFKRVNASSRRANAAIYFVNARGLEGMSSAFAAEFGPAPDAADVSYHFALMNRFDDGSDGIAVESGGFTVKNADELEKGIQRIAREARTYYLLGYVSTNTARDGTFREIGVAFREGKGKGLEIRARRGYYAPSEDGPARPAGKDGIDPVIQAAVDAPWPESGIPLRMTHYVGAERMLGRAGVLMVAELDIQALEFSEVEGRQVAEVGFLLVVGHRETGEFLRYDQAVTMRLRPATRERLNRDWFPIVREFELPQGDHQARLVVRETGTGRVGSVLHSFEVPPLEEFRLTTPILSDTNEPRAAGQGFRPRPLARREFAQGRELVCEFEVYGAARDGAGRPAVTAGHELRRSDGSVVDRQSPTAIVPTSLGALSRQFGLSLQAMTPGEYELTVAVRDELAGKSLEIREPFTVVPPVSTAVSELPEAHEAAPR